MIETSGCWIIKNFSEILRTKNINNLFIFALYNDEKRKEKRKMSTKNRIFSSSLCLTEYDGKYGISTSEGRVLLYPVYDSIWELDDFDFIIEQDGKFGYASFNEENEIELLLPLYDVIIKKEHGLSLIKRGEGEQYLWYDLKSHTLHPNIKWLRGFKEYDVFISTKKCDNGKPQFLKKWGENTYLEIPFDVNIDILYEIPCDKLNMFIMLEEIEDAEYEYSFLIVKENGYYTFSAPKKSKEELYKILPRLQEDLKCNPNIVWLLPEQK